MNKGSNMYSFIDKTRNYLGGECKHKCSYCYVNSMKNKFPNLKERYSGEIRLLDKELLKYEGEGKTIFVQDMGDLFEESVPKEFIIKILNHLKAFDNTYLFQTKNPKRYFEFQDYFPEKSILGTTIETSYDDRMKEISKAPLISERRYWMQRLKFARIFLTIEPILNFNLEDFVAIIKDIQPEFVNIGADSKNHNLKEPKKEKVELLINELRQFTEVILKDNLNRILKN